MKHAVSLLQRILLFASAVTVAVTPFAVTAEDFEGRVVDADTGIPIEGASVYLLVNRTGGITDSQGRFSLAPPETGADTLRVRRLDYRSADIPVPVPGTVEVRLAPELHVIDAVVIRAVRPQDLPPHERTSSSVGVVTKAEIPDRAATVDEVLDSQAGIDIRSLGGTGASSEISIRGSTTEQVAVYVDGVPLTAGGSGLSGLSFVPMSQVESIEIYRGSSPGMFGNGALGGIVSISTAQTGTGAGVNASMSYGSFNTSHQTVMSRFSAGSSRFVLSAGRNASDNKFRFYDDRGTTIDTSDDGWEIRRNSDFESLNLMGRWDIGIDGNHTLMTKVSASDTERGVSGLGRRPALHARLGTKGTLVQTRHRYLDVIETQAWYMSESKNFYDPKDEAGRRGRQDTDDDIAVAGVLSNFSFVRGQVLTHVNLELKRETYESSDSFDTAVTPPSQRLSAGLGVEPEIMLMESRLWIAPRIHYTRVNDELTDTGILHAHSAVDSTFTVGRTTVTYALGARWKARDTLTLRATAGVYPRIPEFNELFGDTGDIVGNTRLHDERGINADAGFHYAPVDTDFKLDASAFYRFADELIQRRSYGDYLISENIGKAEIAGIECLARYVTPGRRASIGFSSAFQDARNRSDETLFRRQRYKGKLLPYHPRWKWASSLRLRLTSRLSASWKADYESDCFQGPSNLPDEKLKARLIHSAAFHISAPQGFEAVLEAVNLSDKHAPDRWGYPKPGRSIYVTLRYTWERAGDE